MTKLFVNTKGVHACPDTVKIPDMGINLKYADGTTFVVGIDTNGDLRLIYSDTLVHTRLILMYNSKFGRLNNRIEGRIWQNEKIISVWNDVASSDMEIIEQLFQQIADIDISDYTFISEFDDHRAFAVSLDTFEKLGVSNNWSENDWNKLASQSKKEEQTSNVISRNGLGFDDRDYMRHFLYAENNIGKNINKMSSVKLNDKQLRGIIAESVKRVLKESIDFSNPNWSQDFFKGLTDTDDDESSSGYLEEEYIGDELETIREAIETIKEKISGGKLAGSGEDEQADNFLRNKIEEMEGILNELLSNNWY